MEDELQDICVDVADSILVNNLVHAVMTCSTCTWDIIYIVHVLYKTLTLFLMLRLQ